MIDFEIDSILDDGDVEDLMLVSFAAPMPHGFGFNVGFVDFGAEAAYGGFAGSSVGASTAIAAIGSTPGGSRSRASALRRRVEDPSRARGLRIGLRSRRPF